MMPIVDAHVSLSQSHFSLQDYVDATKDFYVLRMVCVQQPHPQSWETAEQELHFLQARATTRGSGGFPHAILATVDLADTDRVKYIIELENLDRVCGVSFEFKNAMNANDMHRSVESLSSLQAAGLCLDVQTTSDHVDQIDELAAHQPAMNIIVTLFDAFADDNRQRNTHGLQQFAALKKHNNVFIKLCGIEPVSPISVELFAASLTASIDLFGYERIIFSSGISTREASALFDPLWSMYDKATSLLTARQRDHLFRLNAIRVYDL